MAQAPTKTEAPVASKPTSTERIECRVRKPFFSEHQQLTAIGQSYVWERKTPEDVFPWPLLVPNNEDLHEELEEEYQDARKVKLAGLRNTDHKARLLALLSKEG